MTAERGAVPDFLRIDNVRCEFGGLVAVNDVSFTQKEDEILGIIGPNGAGKSTLFNMIAGMTKPVSGTIMFQGRRIDGVASEKVARLGLVKTFQTSRLFASMSFLENVATAALAKTTNKRHAWQVAEEKLALTGLSDHRHSPARGASTGQRKRLEIARLLALEPRLMLLDEPFGGVDMVAIEELIELLLTLRSSGIAILIIEHNLGAISRLVGRLIAMNLGAIIADGRPEEVTSNPTVIRAYLGDDDSNHAA
jgi:ABC-type branched-subunit amino acid transport system ATPase component